MTIQGVASMISFVGVAAMVGVFLFVLLRSREEAPYGEVQARAYGVRKWFFVVLLVGFFVVPAFTLREMPYSIDSQDGDAMVVEVMAHQWYWTLSQEQVPANRPVVFRVESEDVNHGFGIYNDAKRLIAQVQAMPGYVNELAVEFDVPGTYKLMCLEYCGLAHHGMVAEIHVATAIASQEGL